MPRIGFISALVVSIALIGGALWFRFVRIPPYSADLTSVRQINQFPSEKVLSKGEDIMNASTSLISASSTPLTQTELVSRGLFTDYLALKSQGGISKEQIDGLATQYAERIANFDLLIQKVSQSQILIMPDSEANLVLYGNAVTNILTKYKGLVANLYKNAGDIAKIGSPAFSSFMGSVGKLYKSSADDLLLVRAPASLALNHLNLINNYLESSKIMESLGNTSKNPLQASAALNIYAKNKTTESELLSNIQKMMMANGIMWTSGI